MFKALLMFIISTSLLSVYSQNTDDNTKKKETPNPVILSDGLLYGEQIDASQQILSVREVVSNPEKYKGTNIVVEGIVSESCRSGGCWIVLKDGEMEIRALTQHKFVLPLDQALGVKAVVQGDFDVKEITEDQAKHFAEESGDMQKAEQIKGPQVMYRIKATGIKILN